MRIKNLLVGQKKKKFIRWAKEQAFCVKEAMFSKVQKFVRNTACSEDHKCFGKAAVKVEDEKLQKGRPKIFPGF